MQSCRANIAALFAVGFCLLLAACSPEAPVEHADSGYLTGAEGASLYYRVMGSGQDTVVVVHGGPGAGMNSVMAPFSPLADRFVLVFYDQRGGGRSTLPSDTTQLQPRHFVEDLEAVRRYFDLEKMNVLAHSFGAVVVGRYAMKYPDRLNKMIFHGATGPRHEEAVRIIRAQAAARPPSPDTALSNQASRLLGSLLEGTAAEPAATCRRYEEISAELAAARGDTLTWTGTSCDAPPEAVRYYYRYTAQLAPRYFSGWDFTSGLEDVSAPLLVLYGRRDSLSVAAQREWASAVPNGRLLLVPGDGKTAISDNPDFVVSAIDSFLTGAVRHNNNSPD